MRNTIPLKVLSRFLPLLLLMVSPVLGLDIIGNVADFGSGLPLDGCTVTITQLAYSTTTDASGDFQFIGVPSGSYTLMISHENYHPQFWSSGGCCGQYTGGFSGNTDCDPAGKRNLADITRLIDHVYISKTALCCDENGNVDGDVNQKRNLADITRLIDHIYISKSATAPCL